MYPSPKYCDVSVCRRKVSIYIIYNHGFCIQNDGFCIQNDGFFIQNDGFCIQMMDIGRAAFNRMGGDCELQYKCQLLLNLKMQR